MRYQQTPTRKIPHFRAKQFKQPQVFLATTIHVDIINKEDQRNFCICQLMYLFNFPFYVIIKESAYNFPVVGYEHTAEHIH